MENTSETQEAQPTPSNAATGSEPATASVVDRIDSQLKRLAEVEQRVNEKIAYHEKLLARELLGGRAVAGSTQKSPQELRKEKIDELAARMAARSIPQR